MNPLIEAWLGRQPQQIQRILNIEREVPIATLGATDAQHTALKDAHILSSVYLGYANDALFLTDIATEDTKLYEKWFSFYGRSTFGKVLGCMESEMRCMFTKSSQVVTCAPHMSCIRVGYHRWEDAAPYPHLC